jgi:xylulokinase
MFDLNNLCWSKEIIEAADISLERLPETRSSTELAGYISQEAAQETSLKAGTPVIMGGGDVLCACAGAGVVEEGQFYVHAGSAAWCGTVTARPSLDFKSRQLCLAHVVPGAYAPHHTMYNGGNCEQWIRDSAFNLESSASEAASMNVHNIIESKVRLTPPGSQNLIFLPYMRGGDPPFFDPDARGAFIGLDMGHTKEHLYRAVLEGVAFQLKMILDVFLEHGHEIKEIRFVGGGAENSLWGQIIADVFQREILVPEAPREAGCMGAAMAGGVGIGMFSDLSEAAKMIRIRDTVQPRPEWF